MFRKSTWFALTFVTAALALSTTALAQDVSTAPGGWPEPAARDQDRPPATLFGGSRSPTIGGYGGLGVMYSRVDQNDVALACAHGALLLDHQFSLGIAGCGMPSRVDGSRYTGVDGDQLELGYGGLMLRYHFLSREVVNFSVGGLVGGGGLSFGDWDRHHDGDEWDDDRMHDGFFVAEPQVTVDLNVTRWFRAGVGGGYRFVGGTDTAGLSNSDLAGPTAGAHVAFGWF